MEQETIKIDKDKLIEATTAIMDFCQERGFDELTSYMAMIGITNTMEEELGFGYERRTN